MITGLPCQKSAHWCMGSRAGQVMYLMSSLMRGPCTRGGPRLLSNRFQSVRSRQASNGVSRASQEADHERQPVTPAQAAQGLACKTHDLADQVRFARQVMPILTCEAVSLASPVAVKAITVPRLPVQTAAAASKPIAGTSMAAACDHEQERPCKAASLPTRLF